mmetsp:Transcript_1946/g.7141  ORF Transcript_1946/g.7141 Transcript_1946/m.7141 type:complete len:102 (-) Transcript_1946:101-406(-)
MCFPPPVSFASVRVSLCLPFALPFHEGSAERAKFLAQYRTALTIYANLFGDMSVKSGNARRLWQSPQDRINALGAYRWIDVTQLHQYGLTEVFDDDDDGCC